MINKRLQANIYAVDIHRLETDTEMKNPLFRLVLVDFSTTSIEAKIHNVSGVENLLPLSSVLTS